MSYLISLKLTSIDLTDIYLTFSWYFGPIKRRSADEYLIESPPGTYLIRESETRPGTLSLSLRNHTTDDPRHRLKHYNIRRRDNGQYFISANYDFNTVQDLVDYYTQHTGKTPHFQLVLWDDKAK